MHTADTPPFIDGGSMIAPRGGFFTRDGKWAVENEGVAPDIDVENWPKDVIAGRDPQLSNVCCRKQRTILKKIGLLIGGRNKKTSERKMNWPTGGLFWVVISFFFLSEVWGAPREREKPKNSVSVPNKRGRDQEQNAGREQPGAL